MSSSSSDSVDQSDVDAVLAAAAAAGADPAGDGAASGSLYDMETDAISSGGAAAAAALPAPSAPDPSVTVSDGDQRAQWSSFDEPAGVVGADAQNLNLVLDIPLEMSVELGRKRMSIRDILDLGTGSIVELDKIAGEPVDLLVNGRLVARGEVVVIEDNFGVRITEIVGGQRGGNGDSNSKEGNSPA